MAWTFGRGRLGPLLPLVGRWHTFQASGTSAAAGLVCTRAFTPFGKGWIMLDARWWIAPDREYREVAFIGGDNAESLVCHSYTNDGKSSLGRRTDGSDVHPLAIAFEAAMPAGLARMIYWPLEDGDSGFYFAVESNTKKGWNRFLTQRYLPAG